MYWSEIDNDSFHLTLLVSLVMIFYYLQVNELQEMLSHSQASKNLSYNCTQDLSKANLRLARDTPKYPFC